MNKLLAVVGIAGLAVAGWTIHSHKAIATDGGKLVADRVWIDHMPKSERDMVNVFVVVTSNPVGIFQAASRWQGQFEMFKYEQKANEIRVVFPQTGAKETLEATAKKCDQQGFDFCLQLDGGKHGVTRYYSMQGWDVGTVDAAQARLSQIQGR
jgi:hypothetical protein